MLHDSLGRLHRQCVNEDGRDDEGQKGEQRGFFFLNNLHDCSCECILLACSTTLGSIVEANSLILIVLSFGGEAGCPQWASSLGGV